VESLYAQHEDYGLFLIQDTLMWESNKMMKDVGMCPPLLNWSSLLGHIMQDNLCFDPPLELCHLLQNLPQLNTEQYFAFNNILHAILSNKSKLLFVVGMAEAGKTFLYKTLCHALQSCGLVVLCIAYSGMQPSFFLVDKQLT
jgi:hypothetical protein